MVKCPICSKDVPIQLINKHLDKCELSSSGHGMKKVENKVMEGRQEGQQKKQKMRSSSLLDVLNGGKKKSRRSGGEHRIFSSQFANEISDEILKEGKRKSDPIVIDSTEPDACLMHSDKRPRTEDRKIPSSPVLSGKARQREQIKILKLQSRLPLAERLRPTTLENYIGQKHLVGRGGILRGFIESDRIPSMILWGFPGTGKTTLARIISHSTKSRFVELSATTNGISDCKKIFQEAKNELKLTGRKTIVFVDEIHRFNKAQQDIFLPYVERGTITLIGATTENPSFQLNSALLSRCRVFVLKKLSSDELKQIVCRALVEINKTRKLVYNKMVLKFLPDAVEYICNISDGDSRSALNLLELADSHFMTVDEEKTEQGEGDGKGSRIATERMGSKKMENAKSRENAEKNMVNMNKSAQNMDKDTQNMNKDTQNTKDTQNMDKDIHNTNKSSQTESHTANRHVLEVAAEDLRKVFKRTQMVYDRVGDAHYDTISAFHKSVRGSSPDAAIYYLARMLKGGEDPLYVARRMIRIASEDVGDVDDSCLPFAVAAYRAVQLIGLPEAELALAQCAVKLARAPKSVEIYRAWKEINAKIDNEPDVAAAAIPLHLRNAPTKLMEDLGYSEGYKYNPDYRDGKVKQEYFPKELKGLKLLRGQHLGTRIDPDLER